VGFEKVSVRLLIPVQSGCDQFSFFFFAQNQRFFLLRNPDFKVPPAHLTKIASDRGIFN
jgi:hypothetical protein